MRRRSGRARIEWLIKKRPISDRALRWNAAWDDAFNYKDGEPYDGDPIPAVEAQAAVALSEPSDEQTAEDIARAYDWFKSFPSTRLHRHSALRRCILIARNWRASFAETVKAHEAARLAAEMREEMKMISKTAHAEHEYKLLRRAVTAKERAKKTNRIARGISRMIEEAIIA